MSLVVTSGVVRGPEAIIENRNLALALGFRKGLFKAVDEFLPSIAMKTGRMRRSFKRAINVLMAQKQVVQARQITITWEEIKQIVIALTPYAEYHFRARGFYVSPSTKGTRPMRFRSFKRLAIKHVRREVNLALSSVGLEGTRFSVL